MARAAYDMNLPQSLNASDSRCEMLRYVSCSSVVGLSVTRGAAAQLALRHAPEFVVKQREQPSVSLGIATFGGMHDFDESRLRHVRTPCY